MRPKNPVYYATYSFQKYKYNLKAKTYMWISKGQFLDNPPQAISSRRSFRKSPESEG